jgi:hypothetical protein
MHGQIKYNLISILLKPGTKTWENTVGSTLSTKTHMFESGAEAVGFSGYWGIKSNIAATPTEDPSTFIKERQQKDKTKNPKPPKPKVPKEKRQQFDSDEQERIPKKPAVELPATPLIVFHPSYYGTTL